MAEEEHCPMDDQDIIEDKQPAEAKLKDKSSFLFSCHCVLTTHNPVISQLLYATDGCPQPPPTLLVTIASFGEGFYSATSWLIPVNYLRPDMTVEAAIRLINLRHVHGCLCCYYSCAVSVAAIRIIKTHKKGDGQSVTTTKGVRAVLNLLSVVVHRIRINHRRVPTLAEM